MTTAIGDMYAYNGDGSKTNSTFKAGLARMIIATSEAIRMQAVQMGMLTAIANGDWKYQPDSDAIHN